MGALLALWTAPAQAAPPNDSFAGAQSLPASLPLNPYGETVGASAEAGEPAHAGFEAKHSVWFKWTPQRTGRVRVSVCGFSFDSLLGVYTGSSVGALTEVASNDDDPAACAAGASAVDFTAVAGTTYAIAVDGKGESEGIFQLQIQGSPENDDFADASALFSLPNSAAGSTVLATAEPGEPAHAGVAATHSTWYSWTPSASGLVDLSVCGFGGTTLDTVLAVYTGEALGSLVPVGSDDDDGGCQGGSDVTFTAIAGTRYRIAVDSKGKEGAFFLRFSGPPANDDLAAAQVLASGFAGSVSGSNVLATKEPGEPDHAGNAGGHSVWFSWTPEVSGPVALKATSCYGGHLIDPLLAVYTGEAFGALTPVASNDDIGPNLGACDPTDSEAEFHAVAGTTYLIAVDGKNGREGGFDLEIQRGPANDSFAGATPLPATLSFSESGTTRFASKEPGEPDHGGDPGGHSVWYSWTPSASGPVEITASACFINGFTPFLGVYAGGAVGALTPVSGTGSKVRGFCDGRQLRFDAIAGTTYRIAVDGRAGGQGAFLLRGATVPANDDFANAQQLEPVFIQRAEGTTRLASKEAGEPDHAGEPGGHSVWFAWTPAASGPVEISTETCGGGEADTVLAVYTGNSLGSLTEVASNDDAAEPLCGPESEVDFEAVSGTTYRIAVDEVNGASGSFQLRLRGGPANDDFDAAESISPGANGREGTNRLATAEPGEPSAGPGAGGHTVWYTWTPVASLDARIQVCPRNQDFEPLIAVYQGSAPASLSRVAGPGSLSGVCGEAARTVAFHAVAGTEYRIAVDGSDGSEGAFALKLSGPPANDAFAAALALSQAAYSDNEGATKEPSEPDHARNPGGHSVWFSWTPAVDREVEISACGRGLDTLLAVYTGQSLAGLAPVAADDDGAIVGNGCSPGSSAVDFAALAGTTYRIAVDGKDGDTGSFELGLSEAPENDDFVAARKVELNSGGGFLLTYGSNRFATREAGEPDHAGVPAGHSVWFSWTAESSGPVRLTTCAEESPLDTVLAVYTGESLGGLTPVASDDDGAAAACGATDSEAAFTAVAGTTYRIAVDGKGGSVGSFELDLEHPHANDAFADSEVLEPELPAYGGGSTALATKEPGEPDHAGNAGGHSVWFSWTPEVSGPVHTYTSSCAEHADTLLAVYTGNSLGTLVRVASNDDGGTEGFCESPGLSNLDFDAVAGTTYRIAVDSKGGPGGRFQLILEGVPANDAFHSAQSVGPLPNQLGLESNRFATRELGEPDHAGDPGGHSVWFKWTAPRAEAIVADTCASSFDTVLAIYRGSSVGALTQVAANDDTQDEECSPGGSAIQFTAEAGVTYRLAVDGKPGAEGSFFLAMRPLRSPQTLTVLRGGSGAGRIVSEPAGIDCGSVCSRQFELGRSVLLTASPDPGSSFLGWSGVGCAGSGACRVVIAEATTVEARFATPPTGGGQQAPTPQPSVEAPAHPKPRPVRCRRGFRKVRSHGRTRCVRIKRHRHKRGRGR
jgi:hypothetical protein